MLRGTIMISCVSARVSGVWGTCMFISSPSKSALYGDVTDRFSRKVEYGSTRTRWPCKQHSGQIHSQHSKQTPLLWEPHTILECFDSCPNDFLVRASILLFADPK